MFKPNFIVLIICICVFSSSFGQNIHLTIEGLNIKETNTIDSLNYKKLHKNRNTILHEIDSLQSKLSNIGYLNNELKTIEKTSDSTYLATLNLNNEYKTLKIYYDYSDINTGLIKAISNEYNTHYFTIPIKNTEQALNYLNSKIADSGKPFAQLKLTDIKISNNSVEAQLTLHTNKGRRFLDNIYIKGYEQFPNSFIKHYLKLKKGTTLNITEIQHKTTELNNLNFANEIKPAEVLFTKDSTTVYIYVEKLKSNTFDGFLGFGTNEDNNKLQFDGYLNLNLTNNLNYGETLQLQYKSDENDQKTFETTASLPYLFSSPLGLDLQLRIFKKDSSFTTVNQFAKLSYQINSKHKFYTGITAAESSNLLENTTSNITDYKSTFITASYLYAIKDSDNSLFKTKTRVFLEGGYGNRKTTTTKQKQHQYSIDAFKIFNLNSRNSIYLRTQGATLISDNYFENELFRFGGINSIRGFEENSLYANLFGVLNTEYRYQLSTSIYVHSIFDTAYFENQLTRNTQKLFGYGFGLGVLTKSGLFKLNYANGKTKDSNFSLSNSKIHISLTTTF